MDRKWDILFADGWVTLHFKVDLQCLVKTMGGRTLPTSGTSLIGCEYISIGHWPVCQQNVGESTPVAAIQHDSSPKDLEFGAWASHSTSPSAVPYHCDVGGSWRTREDLFGLTTCITLLLWSVSGGHLQSTWTHRYNQLQDHYWLGTIKYLVSHSFFFEKMGR